MGNPFVESKPFDVFNRTIEPENRAIFLFLQDFLPDRVTGTHAIRDPAKAGVFADPAPTARELHWALKPTSNWH